MKSTVIHYLDEPEV